MGLDKQKQASGEKPAEAPEARNFLKEVQELAPRVKDLVKAREKYLAVIEGMCQMKVESFWERWKPGGTRKMSREGAKISRIATHEWYDFPVKISGLFGKTTIGQYEFELFKRYMAFLENRVGARGVERRLGDVLRGGFGLGIVETEEEKKGSPEQRGKKRALQQQIIKTLSGLKLVEAVALWRRSEKRRARITGRYFFIHPDAKQGDITEAIRESLGPVDEKQRENIPAPARAQEVKRNSPPPQENRKPAPPPQRQDKPGPQTPQQRTPGEPKKKKKRRKKSKNRTPFLGR